MALGKPRRNIKQKQKKKTNLKVEAPPPPLDGDWVPCCIALGRYMDGRGLGVGDAMPKVGSYSPALSLPIPKRSFSRARFYGLQALSGAQRGAKRKGRNGEPLSDLDTARMPRPASLMLQVSPE